MTFSHPQDRHLACSPQWINEEELNFAVYRSGTETKDEKGTVGTSPYADPANTWMAEPETIALGSAPTAGPPDATLRL
jgi:hypothetical protein